MGTVSYRVFGPLAVLRDGVRADLGPEQRQRILAALLLKSNQAVSPTELVAAAWDGAPPPDATQVVGKHVDVLRELVDPSPLPGTSESLITLADGNYVLCVEPSDSDLSQFSGLVAEAGELQAAGKHQEAATKLRAALALWRGTPLEGLPGYVLDRTRHGLAEVRRQAQDTVADLEGRLSYQRKSTFPTPGAPVSSATFPAPTPAPGYPQPAFQQPQQPMQPSRPSLAKVIVLKLLGAAVPVVSIGFLGWAMTAGVAIKRRSVALGISAAVYLAITVWFTAYVMVPEGPEISDKQGLLTLLYVLAGIACAVQAAVVIGSSNSRRPQPPYLLHPQLPQYQVPQYQPQQPMGRPAASSADAVLRSQARQLAITQPAYARSLGIGRPDLPRQYDDGGLIDLNDAPADLLDTLPGITGRQAAAIVLSRTQNGRFRLVDELWTRGLLPTHLTQQLADRLVIIDIQDAGL